MTTRKRSKRTKNKVRRIVPAADGVRVIVHCVNECGTKYTTAKRGDNKVEWTKTLRRLNAHECKRCRGSAASSLSQPAAHAGRQKLFGRPALRHLPLFGSGDSSEDAGPTASGSSVAVASCSAVTASTSSASSSSSSSSSYSIASGAAAPVVFRGGSLEANLYCPLLPLRRVWDDLEGGGGGGGVGGKDVSRTSNIIGERKNYKRGRTSI